MQKNLKQEIMGRLDSLIAEYEELVSQAKYKDLTGEKDLISVVAFNTKGESILKGEQGCQ